MAPPPCPGSPGAGSSTSWGRESSPPRPRLVRLTTGMPCSPPMAWGVHLARPTLPVEGRVTLPPVPRRRTAPRPPHARGSARANFHLPNVPCQLGSPFAAPSRAHPVFAVSCTRATDADVHPVTDCTWKRSPKLKALRQSTNEPQTLPYVACIFSNIQLAPEAGDTPMTVGLRQVSPPAQA